MANGLDDLDAPSYSDWLARHARGGGKKGRATMVMELPGMLAKKVGGDLATLPSRALEAAGELQRGGEYDPGPALEAAMLGPGVSFPKVLARGGDPNSLAALYLKPRGLSPGYYGVVNEAGEQVASMTTRYRPQTKTVEVEGLYARDDLESPLTRGSVAQSANPQAYVIGPKDIRSLVYGLKKEYPEAENLAAFRVSGARTTPEAGGSAIVNMRMPKITKEQLDAYLEKAPKNVQIGAPVATFADLVERGRMAARRMTGRASTNEAAAGAERIRYREAAQQALAETRERWPTLTGENFQAANTFREQRTQELLAPPTRPSMTQAESDSIVEMIEDSLRRVQPQQRTGSER